MKIQCACGTKYAFDVTPEMACAPIQFACQNCGLDISATINQLIRQELGVASASVPLVAPPVVIAPPPPNARGAAPAVSVGAAPQVVPVSVAPSVSAPPPPPVAAPALRVSVAGHSAAASGSASPSTPSSEPCAKHPGQAATH